MLSLFFLVLGFFWFAFFSNDLFSFVFFLSGFEGGDNITEVLVEKD